MTLKPRPRIARHAGSVSCSHIAACALALLLAASLFPAPGSSASADEPGAADEAAQAQAAVDGAQLSLDDAEARMTTLSADYEALSSDAAAIQARIDESVAAIELAQADVVAGRAVVAQAAASEYRSGGAAGSFLSLLLDSSSFEDLLRNAAYLTRIMESYAQQVADQQDRVARFEALLADLNSQKDAHDARLSELERTRAEAQAVVDAASSQLADAQDAQERLAALKSQADAMAATGAVSEPVVVAEANTVERQDVVSDDAPVIENPAPVVPDADASTGGGSSGSTSGGASGDGEASDGAGTPTSPGDAQGQGGWQTGVASAYGGSTDPYTPNPGTTATGAVCDDFSMGVAVPMAWPNYWQYYGRKVEISYGGMTVIATVNDCGYMGGGSRSLDLQPGVWKAFGFSSCTDWGLRTVNYRFL